jgi:Bacterial regulatory proteins, gntR family
MLWRLPAEPFAQENRRFGLYTLYAVGERIGMATVENLQLGPESRQLDSEPVSEQVYRVLRDAICDGVFSDHAHLVQNQFADRLQVTRTPVRDALLHLAPERSDRGESVRRPSGHRFCHLPGNRAVSGCNLSTRRLQVVWRHLLARCHLARVRHAGADEGVPIPVSVAAAGCDAPGAFWNSAPGDESLRLMTKSRTC